jgi:DNA-nicking Smr family endonuclease
MESLDLHGVRHSDAQKCIDQFLWSAMQKNTYSVEIITGCSDEMKKIVEDVVWDYGLACETSPHNWGCLVVTLK